MPKYLVQHRRGTAEQWAEQGTLIPREGEIVIEIDEVNSLHKLKIGDGVHTYAELAYLKAGDEIVTQVLAEAKPRVITVELSESWAQDSDDKYYQTLALEGITNHSRLDLQPSVDMLAEFKQLGLVFVTENNSGVITVYSVGNMPQKAYTMQATIVETECNGEDACIIGAPIGTPVAQSNWSQTDSTKADFIKNKPTLGTLAAKDEVAKADLASDVQTSLGKADTAIQSIDGLATEDYVDNKVGALGSLASKSIVEKTDLSTDVQASLNKADTALQSFTEVDPTVPDWAKEPTKPSYTASEVHAVPDDRTINGKSLSANITLEPSDIGALPDTTPIPSIDGLATTQYVDNAVAGIVDSSPEALNTLNELAAALGDDPNFATTVANEIGKKADADDIPKALADLTADSTHRTVTDDEKAAWNAKSNFSGSYNDLTNKPTIPTKTSELTNDIGFKTTDNNTTYTFTTGDSNGQIKVTSSDGTAQNVSVKGLGSAAYTASTDYAPSSHVGDSTHVSATEKAAWNAKSNFSGNYNDLTNKPTTENWTFTLEDGSTVTKAVYVK